MSAVEPARRARSPWTRALSLAALAVTALGCSTEAYCFADCAEAGTGGTAGTAGSGGSSGTGGFIDPDGGHEAGQDADTDADTDANCGDTRSDPQNCGTCGNVCRVQGAFPACQDGRCVISACDDGFVDADGRVDNGCECELSNTGVEICDGRDNDCNGTIDDGFDVTSDPNHCGVCNRVCEQKDHSVMTCNAGVCTYTCEPGYAKPRGGNSPSQGCSYQCPVFPTVAEVCNGLDDDCNGLVDDNPSDVGASCGTNCPGGVCVGECSPGTMYCINGVPSCLGGKIPSIEICDGKDNDCDGTADEGINTQTDPRNCGACNNVCSLPNAVSNCANGTCGVLACRPGFRDLNNDPTDGCEHTCAVYPTGPEVCDGRDNDCNGLVDDNVPAVTNFCTQTGPCAGAVPVCQGTSGWRCNYASRDARIEVQANGSLLPVETRCDNFDNNCNGQVDETFTTKGTACSVGNGLCAGHSTFTCSSDGSGVTCNATPNPNKARDEICNGLDDNCDGNVDERNPSGTRTCYTNDSGAGAHTCLGLIEPMIRVNGSLWIHAYEASRPDATDSSAGGDDTRACSRPDVLPWTSINRASAAAACAALRSSTGAAMRLCTETEWQAGCRGAANQSITDPIWSYRTAPTTYVAQRCNDAANNLLAPWLTGSATNCAANWDVGANTGQKFGYDFSGNVSEWTGSRTTVNGVNYSRVMGGNYATQGPATSCNFTFVLQRETFRNFDVGFRCCSGTAP